MRTILSIFIAVFITTGCLRAVSVNSDSKPVTHEKFTALLKKHVNSNGMVNYKGFIADSTALNEYLAILESHHPNEEVGPETTRRA